MGIIRDVGTRFALYKHLKDKPDDSSTNDRLLKFMQHPRLLSPTTLSVIVEEYRQSLPIWDGPSDCPYVPGYHQETLLNALTYAMDSHNSRASHTLASILSDSGSAIEVAEMARERNDVSIAQTVLDMSRLRRDIVVKNSSIVKQVYGIIPHATERAVAHFTEVYQSVQKILGHLLPATH